MQWLNLTGRVSIVALVLFGFPAHAQQKPWSKEQIVTMLKGDVSPKRVAELARERGIGFQISPEIESELRQAGANDELISTLRDLASKPISPGSPEPAALVVETTPGGAQVYVDDEPLGKTSPEGRLRLSHIPAGSHTVRIELDGYGSSERKVECTAGQTAELTVHLEAKKPLASPAAVKATSLPPGNEQAENFRLVRYGGTRGVLTVSPGRIVWRDIENGIGRHVEDFVASCQDIVEVKRNRSGVQAFHIRLKNGKSYNLWSGDEKVGPQPFMQAIANACPR